MQATLKTELTGISATADAIITANTMSDNFAFLEVYYEDLNYETMTENPAYEASTNVSMKTMQILIKRIKLPEMHENPDTYK